MINPETGTEECDTCADNCGYITCPECDGDDPDCEECNGSGEVDCPECQ
jgi:hypothetical protein